MKTVSAVSLSVLLAAAAAVPAAGEVVSSDTFPTQLIVNAATCPLMPDGVTSISGSGVLTIQVRTTTNKNGVHIGVHVNGHGTATDDSGDTWRWSDADLFEPGSVNASDHKLTQTIVESFHLIGPRGEQIRIQGTFHVTVVDGQVVVELEKGNESAANEPCEGFIF
jgi:hypothetical protein